MATPPNKVATPTVEAEAEEAAVGGGAEVGADVSHIAVKETTLQSFFGLGHKPKVDNMLLARERPLSGSVFVSIGANTSNVELGILGNVILTMIIFEVVLYVLVTLTSFVQTANEA